jgi:hypothetical protein
MGSVNTARDATEGKKGSAKNERDGENEERTGERGGGCGDETTNGDGIADRDRRALDDRRVERCFDCRRDRTAVAGCTTATITFPDGRTRDAIAYGAEPGRAAAEDCPGCGVAVGGFHHPFCPVEACPQCSGRLVACDCLDSDKTR